MSDSQYFDCFYSNYLILFVQISIPKNCTGIERFCNVKETQQSFYRFSVLRHSFKLIQAADKVILRMAEQDVLNLNIVFKDNLNSFADFYVSII